MLAELGINLNLAPVVDLNTNPDNPVIGRLERSFSADPAVVTEHALAFIRAHHEHQVLCSLKHFPGHGSSATDSHLGLVDVTSTWSSAELEPYARIIEAGEADTIMTAHVFNATLDPTYPATLSRPTITGILRDRLHYGGVVLCDDLQMGAIREQYGYETAVEAVIAAGVDILVIANNTVYEEGITARTVAIIKQLMEDGKVSEARIDESHGRIQRLKSRLAPQPRNVS
jgi:beta-N-acetylhexosaminidase